MTEQPIHVARAEARAPVRATATGTFDELVSFLRDVADRADRGDLPAALGVFPRAYLRMTLELVARLSSGLFEDPAWIAGFAVDFGAAYRRALERPRERSAAWGLAFDHAVRHPDRVISHLMLGINAHMAYDLANVASRHVDVSAKRRRDYFALDEVIRHAIDPIGKLLGDRYGRWIHRTDRIAAGVDEALCRRLFERTRARAFRDGVALREGAYSVEQLDRRVTAQGQVWAALLRA